MDELIDELEYLWQKSVERRIKKDEKILIPLSGGLDSRAILAAALKHTSKENIISFTFGTSDSLDFEIGRLVAGKAGVKNIELGVENKDSGLQYKTSIEDIEGMIDSTPYSAIMGYREMKKYGDNILSGYIGDFVMGSHMFSEMLHRNGMNENQSENILNIFNIHESLFDLETIKNIFAHSFFDTNYNPYSEGELISSKNNNMANIFFNYFFENHVNKYSYFAVFKYKELFNYYCPFLDNDLIDFMCTISPEMRYNQKLYRTMLIKKYPELFELPTKNNLGLKLNSNKVYSFFKKCNFFFKDEINKISTLILRRNLYSNKLKNYHDYDDLLRRNKEYKEYIRSMLSKVEKREYFNEDFIEIIWKLHMKGIKNYSIIFGLLVTFELFLQNFIDE